jgi:hypothetical protein
MRLAMDTVRRTLVFGSLDIITPSLQHMHTSPDTAWGIGTVHDECRG